MRDCTGVASHRCWSGFLCCLALLGSPLFEQAAHAQWSLGEMFVPVVEDFSGFAAPSTWGTASPAASQLDSDIWAFSSSSATGSTASTFGLNYINGKGINTGGVSVAGVYAFDNGAGLTGIGPQANDSSWTEGNLTVKLRNDTGSTIEKLRVEWTYLVYNDQSGRRASQLLVSSTGNAGTYGAPFGGEVVTADAAQGSLFWLNFARDITFNANILDGNDYFLRWSFADLTGAAGSGVNRDEVGIANLRITPLVEVTGDFDENGIVDGTDFLHWQENPGVGSLVDWETNYGFGGLTGNVALVPEPAVLSLAGIGIGCVLRMRSKR